MRILTVSFACEPGGATEAGNGWNWPFFLAARGHDVTVITAARWRRGIEEYLSVHSVPGLSFHYVSAPAWPLRVEPTTGSAVQYLVWQWRVAELARRLDAESPFDVLHHASYGSLLGGSFLWRLGRPIVFGPTGGGQTTPPAFREDFGSAWPAEALRNLVVRRLARFAWPAMRCARSATVLSTNEETDELAARLGARSVDRMLDVGLVEGFFTDEVSERGEDGALELVWVGRVMPRKGLLLTLDALAVAASTADVRLTIVGAALSSEFDAAVDAQIEALGLSERVRRTGRVPWSDVREAYRGVDAFVLTSLRDSCGAQLLEAMASGLPVITLDHQGAAELVCDGAGLRAKVGSRGDTVRRVAEAIVEMADAGAAARRAMGSRALDRAREFEWTRRAAKMEQTMEALAAEAASASHGLSASDYAALNVRDRGGETDDYTAERYRQFGRYLPASCVRVLDVGCGPGRGGAALKGCRPELSLVGFDVVQERVDGLAQDVYAGGLCGSVTDICLDDGAVDAIVAGELIEHLSEVDVERALREFARVLGPGGTLMLTTPNPEALKVVLRGGTTLGAAHLTAHRPRVLRQRLLAGGFVDVRLIGSGRATRVVGERLPWMGAYGSYLAVARRR